MLLELDFGIKVGNKRINEIEEFTRELNNVLQDDKILVYQGYDSTKFTNINEEKIWDKKEELIREYINENNINGADENKLYEISYESSKGFNVIEYDENYENRTTFIVDFGELPKNVKEGMFFRKIDDSYILDKETTKKIYNEMINFQNDLIAEQKEVLNDMRQEGAIYKVTYLEDDCENWRTELTNQRTGEIFQELEFPHDVYHQVGVNSLVKYEKGTYTVVEGTSVYDLYSNTIENYCENEGVYITQKGKYETSNELYESLNMNNEEKLMRKVTNAIEKILKFAVDKLVELVKNKQ